jgi:transcriptional regulator with XRE-family HTH domain
MKLNRTSAVMEYKFVSSFATLRSKLLSQKKYADRLEKPLAYWALPNDRRLPLAFMDRSVRQLLDTPFEELYATPGVGQKKIHSLLNLLARAAKAPVPKDDPVTALLKSGEIFEEDGGLKKNGKVNPTTVSEAAWVRWRNTVRQYRLEDYALGQLAPSLEQLPRVLWDTTLDTYLDLTLGQIRHMKTHGEKRVHAILQIFGGLHHLLGDATAPASMAVHIVPKIVDDVDRWISSVLISDESVGSGEIRENFVEPLIAQVRIDAGVQMARLTESRLAIRGRGATVRQSAKRLGLTRARVYQLLGDVADIIQVRWPEGAGRVDSLIHHLNEFEDAPGESSPFYAAIELFFPGSCPEFESEDSITLSRAG